MSRVTASKLKSCSTIALMAGLLTVAAPAFAKGKPESPGANGLAVAAAAQEKNGTGQGKGVAAAQMKNSDVDSEESEGDIDDLDDDSDVDQGKGSGRTVVLAGLNTTTQTYLRFANFGQSAGNATVVLHDAETGNDIGTWSSPTIPSRGALETSLAEIAGSINPILDPVPESLIAEIRASFNGHVQHVGFNSDAGQISDLTACRRLEIPKRALGYVAGPGRTDVGGMVQLINGENEPDSAVLHLFDGETGQELGTWTSPSVPEFALISLNVADIVTAATPAIADAPNSLTFQVDSPSHLAVHYLEGVIGGAVSDFSAGCVLKGGGVDDESEDAEDAEDEGGDDEGDAGSESGA